MKSIKNEFLIISKDGRYLLYRKVTKKDTIQYHGGTYTIRGFEQNYAFVKESLFDKRYIYIFRESNATPVPLGAITREFSAESLATVVELLSFATAQGEIYKYLKLLVAVSIITLVVAFAISYLVYQYLPQQIQNIVAQEISKAFVKPQ